MTTLELERLINIYEEICSETGMTMTAKGYEFFVKVMYNDYLGYCDREGIEPSWISFKRNCLVIAMEMIEEMV